MNYKFAIKSNKGNEILYSFSQNEKCVNCLLRELNLEDNTSKTIDCDGRKRIGLRNHEESSIALCVNDASIKSNKYYNFLASAISDSFLCLYNQFVEMKAKHKSEYDNLLHNIITLNTKGLQIFENLIDEEKFLKAEDKRKLLTKILYVDSNTAGKLIGIRKSMELIRSQIIVNDLGRGTLRLSKGKHVLYKLVQIAASYFWEDFKEKNISIQFGNSYEAVYVDYDTIIASLIHFFDNTAKYGQPNGKIDIQYILKNNFVIMTIGMTSTFIHKEELEKIYEPNYSGIEPHKLGKHGKGIGLGAIKRLIEKNDGEFLINPGKLTKSIDNVLYSDNTFEIKLPTKEYIWDIV